MPKQEADYEIDVDWSEATPAPVARTTPRSTVTPKPADDFDDDDDSAQFAGQNGQSEPVTAQVISQEDDRDLALVQGRAAKAEGAPITEGAVVENHDTVELLGKKFRIAERIGLMPLLKYASAADMSTDDPRALGAVYMMLKDCIYEGKPACGNCDQCTASRPTMCKAYDAGDWRAFEDHALETKADAEELMPVISQVMEIIAGRPTPPRDGSSATPPATQRVSTANGSGTRRKGSRR